MLREPVSSSNLQSVGYDEFNNILEIEFNNNTIYQYYGVSPHIHNGLMSSSSHGAYFDRYVKNGGYRYKKIR